MIAFLKRYIKGEDGPQPQSPIPVTITGTGSASYCYATIGGTKRYSASSGTIEVMPGDVITFGVYGYSSTYYGRVTVDGTKLINVTTRETKTVNWTVPDGVKTITMAMTYTSTNSRRNGRIVVTTT